MIRSKIYKITSLPGRTFRWLLYLYFGFDKWHVNPLKGRKYAQDIIKYLNAKPQEHRGVVIEIGCGLGDLLRNIKFEKKIGLDLDEHVLEAARFVAKLSRDKNSSFAAFTFPASGLQQKADTIILVNWIHHIEPVILRQKIEEYYKHNLYDGGEIIIDTVQDPSYKINHSIQYLTNNLTCKVTKVGDDIRNREVFSISKIK